MKDNSENGRSSRSWRKASTSCLKKGSGRRILILSASSGNGHVRAAEALEKAFRLQDAQAEIQQLDALTLVSPAMRAVYSRAYIRMVNKAPAVLGWLYNHLDAPYKDERRRLLMNRINSLPLAKAIVSFKPDLVVCTHFLPADIVSMLLAKRRIKARHAVVVTDFDAHGMWLTRNVDRYFVALPETKEHLIQLGVAASLITVSGIPIDPIFAEVGENSQAEAAQSPPSIETLKKLRVLDKTRPTLIVSAGGLGVGPVEELIEALVKAKVQVNVIAMCGKNEELKERLEQTYAGEQCLRLLTLGYVNNVQDYMKAADVIVGKPGGLTTAEALASGLAFVIVNPIPGQEERNSAHLLENGAAIRCNNMTTIGYKLKKLLEDPLRLAELKLKAHAMSRPNAAMKIAKHLSLQPKGRQPREIMCNSTVPRSA